MSINLEEDKCTFAFKLSRLHEKVILDFYDKQCLSRNYRDYLDFTFEYENINIIIRFNLDLIQINLSFIIT